MRAGRLRRRITFQSLTVTQDAEFGTKTEAWVDFKTVWAEFVAVDGREFWAAQQISAEQPADFEIRRFKGLDPTMRILYADRQWDIKSISEAQKLDKIRIKAMARIG